MVLHIPALLLIAGPVSSQVVDPASEAAISLGREVRATRAEGDVEIDGFVREEAWVRASPISGFKQRWPVDGSPASEETEVRVVYDDQAIYLGLIMFDSEPEAIRRSVLHREGALDQDDLIRIGLDTYHDHRSGYVFEVNPLGTQRDGRFTNEQFLPRSGWAWDGVWETAAQVTARGWELEVRIPLTTIRFDPENVENMGLAVFRSIRRKNEEVTWPHLSLDFAHFGGMDQASSFGDLKGMKDLKPGRHAEVKPFFVAGAQSRSGQPETETTRDIGLDVKWSVTPSVTADLTYNTDFAQVEADNVQINLTRFALYYPEKREFFLERGELFQFGSSSQAALFFSRRIGLTNDILGGGRLAGRMGRYTVGFLNLQTRDNELEGVPGANNTVFRLRRDLGSRGTVGGIFTNLQNSETSQRSAGVDARFRFHGNSGVRVWAADTWSESGVEGGTSAGYFEAALREDWFTLQADYLNIGEQFEPALGFVPRRDMIRYQGYASWNPRFEESPWARQFALVLFGNHIEGQDGGRQSERAVLQSNLSLRNGSSLSLGLSRRWERLEHPFHIRSQTEILRGDYSYHTVGLTASTDNSRDLSAHGVVQFGQYWGGDRAVYSGGLTWKTGPHLTLTGNGQHVRIDLPVDNGEFSTTILGLDILGAVNRELFAGALIQYDNVSETLQANVRVNWIHTPGSDLFLVVNTGYFQGLLDDPREDRWVNRAGMVKLTYMKAF